MDASKIIISKMNVFMWLLLLVSMRLSLVADDSFSGVNKNTRVAVNNVPGNTEILPLNSGRMVQEPLLFIKHKGSETASGKLLYMPIADLEIKNPDGSMQYELNRDYYWIPGTRQISLTKESRIPFKTFLEMAPGHGKPKTIGGVLHAEGRYFYDLQMMVSYTYEERIEGLIRVPDATLHRSIKKLRNKKPFKIVALGDSITKGYNASGFKKSKAPRNQEPYAGLVKLYLEQQFDTQVSLINLAVPGKRSEWGISMLDQVKQEDADLILLAFGMNDRLTPNDFEKITREMVAQVKQDTPSADIIIVSPMMDNPVARKKGRIIGFRNVLTKIELPNVGLADVTNPWIKLLERKNFSDLSGNNINHPNDFGHRLYGQVISEFFKETANKDTLIKTKQGEGLPRVLIIGDSISLGYTSHVQLLMKGKAEIVHHKGNAGPTIRGLRRIDQWLGDSQWDLIHFNFGLWDMYGWEYAEDERTPNLYGKRLEILVQRLKKTGAKLIWATTTPVCSEPEVAMKRRFNSNVVISPALEQQYLDVASEIMKKHNIRINDLHALMKPKLETFAIAPNDVHFKPSGRKKMAKQVAEMIQLSLE